MKMIYKIFLENKYKLSLIYVFSILTDLLLISEPFLLGKGIDELILGSYNWIILLSVVYLTSNLLNYRRMIYDTKIYTEIYNKMVLGFLYKTDVDSSKKIARTDMANEVIDVLDGYISYYISTIITVIGTILFIFSTNIQVGFSLVIALILIITATNVFYKKIRQSTIVRNNHYENKVDALMGSENKITTFFKRRRRLLIFESTLQGKNWFWVNLIKYSFLIISIIVLVQTSDNLTTGSVISVYSYVNKFLISLMSIPIGIEMYCRIGDILKRIS